MFHLLPYIAVYLVRKISVFLIANRCLIVSSPIVTWFSFMTFVTC